MADKTTDFNANARDEREHDDAMGAMTVNAKARRARRLEGELK